MRVRALFLFSIAAVLLTILPSADARAGGNWLDIRRDDDVPGGPWDSWAGPFAVGTALEVRATLYARGAAETNALHGAGPFYPWIVPDRVKVVGERMPDEAVRLDPFDLRWTGGHGVVATASITVPATASGRYSILVCNDPCTYLGFGEGVQGWLGVAQTAEAATFQRRNDRLEERIREYRQRIARATGREEEVRAALDVALARHEASQTQITTLREHVAAAQHGSPASAARPTDRALLDAFGGGALGIGLLAIAGALILRRRSPRDIVPDTPEELMSGSSTSAGSTEAVVRAVASPRRRTAPT